MDGNPDLFEWMKKLPTWITGAIGFTATIISFVVLLQGKYHLGLTIIGVLLLASLLLLSLYIVYAKTEPLVVGGKGVYRFESYRLGAFISIGFIILITGILLASESCRSILKIAFTETETPTSTPSPTSTATSTPSPSATHTPTAALGVTDITKDIRIKLAHSKDYFDHPYNKLNFVISNMENETFLVDSIWLEITRVDSYETTWFPGHPVQMTTDPAEYGVTIDPNHSRYLVTDDNSLYGPGEVKEFTVDIRPSEAGYIYQVVGKIDWYALSQPGTRKQLTLKPHFVDFSIPAPLDDFLRIAEQIDYYLDDSCAIQSFIGVSTRRFCSSSYYLLDKRTARCLIAGDELTKNLINSEVPDLSVRYSANPEGINLSHYGTGSQYLIIDSEIVIQQIGYREAEIIKQPEKVQQYIQHFDQLWHVSQEN